MHGACERVEAEDEPADQTESHARTDQTRTQSHTTTVNSQDTTSTNLTKVLQRRGSGSVAETVSHVQAGQCP